MTNSEIMNVILKAMPLKDQIENLDLEKHGAINFDWRGEHFRVDENLDVMQNEGKTLAGDNISIILEALLKRAYSQIRST